MSHNKHYYTQEQANKLLPYVQQLIASNDKSKKILFAKPYKTTVDTLYIKLSNALRYIINTGMVVGYKKSDFMLVRMHNGVAFSFFSKLKLNFEEPLTTMEPTPEQDAEEEAFLALKNKIYHWAKSSASTGDPVLVINSISLTPDQVKAINDLCTKWLLSYKYSGANLVIVRNVTEKDYSAVS